MVNTNELKSQIIRNGYIIKTLAEAMGITENTLGRKVSGKTAFTVPQVLQICELLHIVDPERKVAIFLPDITH